MIWTLQLIRLIQLFSSFNCFCVYPAVQKTWIWRINWTAFALRQRAGAPHDPTAASTAEETMGSTHRWSQWAFRGEINLGWRRAVPNRAKELQKYTITP
jgi:hypothetical protein